MTNQRIQKSTEQLLSFFSILYVAVKIKDFYLHRQFFSFSRHKLTWQQE
jgi:hypothetical protein